MSQVVPDFRALVADEPEFGAAEVQQIQAALANDATQYQTLRQVAGQLQERIQASAGSEANRLRLRLGIVECLLGRCEAAIENLRESGERGLADFYLGKALAARGKYQEAAQAFQKAADSGFDPPAAKLQRAGALRSVGQRDEALRLIKQNAAQAPGTGEDTDQPGPASGRAG